MDDTASVNAGESTLKRKASKITEDPPKVDPNTLLWQEARVVGTPGPGIAEYSFKVSATGITGGAYDPTWEFKKQEFVEVRVFDGIMVVDAQKEPVSSRLAREGRTSG